MHANRREFTERELRRKLGSTRDTAVMSNTRDNLPERLRAIAADEMAGRQPVLSPGNSHDLLTAADEIERLREAIRRLADQDATLSLLCKRDGSQVVTVTMDATLTDEERTAVEFFARLEVGANCNAKHAATLRDLLERLGGGR